MQVVLSCSTFGNLLRDGAELETSNFSLICTTANNGPPLQQYWCKLVQHVIGMDEYCTMRSAGPLGMYSALVEHSSTTQTPAQLELAIVAEQHIHDLNPAVAQTLL